MAHAPQDPAWLDGDAVARWAAAERDDVDGEIAERMRVESAHVTLADRWRNAAGRPVVLRLLGGHGVSGRVADAGGGWLELQSAGRVVVVRAEAVVAVDGLAGAGGRADRTPATEVGPGHPLRRLQAARRPVRLLLGDGTAVDGSLALVGTDAVDVVRHPADRGSRVDDPWTTVPWGAVAAVVSG